MSKIIKKQLKRSFPVVLIFLLLNFTIFGVMFNLRLSEANADTATSSVTVRNAPPSYTVNAAENPTSSSTSPVNVGGSIGFNATADDPELNNYYLIVCGSNNVTAATLGPTCAQQFCVSGATPTGNQASCTYNSVADPGAETRDWYAFVCDNHPTEPACSLANQGSGDSGSPFYVNHAPTFTAINTTVNNQDPGGTFTFQATASDNDIQGGDDYLILSVCSTNSWSAATGCTAQTLCTGTSTDNVSCQYTTPVPTADGTVTYYGFVKDWHTMQAAASRSSTYTTNNVAPTISNILFNNGAQITLLAKGNTTTVWATSTSVSDNNGCDDITGATSTVYLSSVAGGANCSADNNNCYKVLAANCFKTSCVGGSALATMACRVSFEYHAIPTVAAGDNPYAADNWLFAINPYDEALSGTDTSPGVEMGASTALDVTEATIPYGIIQAGQNSGSNNATTTVVNYGNTPLASAIDGTWMSKGGDHIAENNQTFGLNTFAFPGPNLLSSSTPISLNVVDSRPTSGVNVSSPVYWGIAIPSGQPSGDYSGTNSFIAALWTVGGNWN